MPDLAIGRSDTSPDLEVTRKGRSDNLPDEHQMHTHQDVYAVEPETERPAFVPGPRIRASRVDPDRAARDVAMFQAVLDAYAAHGLEPRGVQGGRREWTKLCTEGDGLDVPAALAAIKVACARMAGYVEDARRKGDTDPGRFAKAIVNLLRDAPWADAKAGAEARARVDAAKPAAPPEPARRVVSTADWVRLGERLERDYGIKLRSAIMVEADARRAGVTDPNVPDAAARVAAAIRKSGTPEPRKATPAPDKPIDVGRVLDALAGKAALPAERKTRQRFHDKFSTRAVDKPEEVD